MRRNKFNKIIVCFAGISLLSFWPWTGFFLISSAATQAEEINLEYDFSAPQAEFKIGYSELIMLGADKYEVPGQPVLPMKTVKILIPPGHQIKNIKVIGREETLLPGKYLIEFTKTPSPIGFEDENSSDDKPDPSIYDSTDYFPKEIYTSLGYQEFRGYQILFLNLYPVRYRPKLGQVSYFKKMQVKAEFMPAAFDQAQNQGIKNLASDENWVAEEVDNPWALDNFLNSSFPLGNSTSTVIITSEALKNAFQPLADQKISRGVSTEIVTVEYVSSTPDFYGDGQWGDGAVFDDLAARIRNFIRYAQSEWQTEYVLLGGDVSIIPARSVYTNCCDGGDCPLTPSDLYYGALDGSWNYDQDSNWGEYGDGVSGGEIDLLADVYIGRAPVETVEEVNNFITKTIGYENTTSTAPYLEKGFFFATDSFDFSSNQSIIDNQIPPYFSIDRWQCSGTCDDVNTAEVEIYPTNQGIISEMNAGRHLISHYGHAGASNIAGIISPADMGNVTTTDYFLFNTVGCWPALFTEEDCVGESFVKDQPTGAFAFIGNTRWGWSGIAENYQSEFFDAIYQEHIPQLGRAMADMRADLVSGVGHTGYSRMSYMEQTLLGDPETPVFTWNHDPTLNWTNQVNFTNRGINPQKAVGGSVFEFRTRYTDEDNNAPKIYQVWIDKNDDGNYGVDEKYSMTAGSGTYTSGKIFSKTIALNCAGDGTLNYKFYFSDGQYEATGPPSSDQTFQITRSPTLDWAGEAGFTNDGVEPSEASSGAEFQFRIKYTDLDNDSPTAAQVWINLNDNTGYETNEKFNLTEVDPNDTTYTDGKLYSKTLTIDYAGDGTLNYKFYFSDSTAAATGSPTSNQTLKVNPPTYAPTLSWTGESDFINKGVYPDLANSGASREFRIKYTDQDNGSPTIKQLWIDIDDNGVYGTDEKFNLTEVDPNDTTYTDGKLYTKTLTIDYAGDGTLNYKFYFSDGQYEATGTPCSDNELSVLDTTAPTISNRDPVSGATNKARSTNIYFEIDDSQAGVDQASLNVTINSQSAISGGAFQSGFSGSITSDGTKGFNVTISPNTNFSYSATVTVRVLVSDLAAAPNQLDNTYSFEIESGGGGGGGGSGYLPSVSGTILINNGNEKTDSSTVILTLAAEGASQILISNFSDFSDVNWENFTTTKTWTLSPGLGEKIVYVKFKNAYGIVSSQVSDTINVVAKKEAERTPLQESQVGGGRGIETGQIKLIKTNDSPAVYLVVNQTKQVFPHAAVFKSWGYPWQKIETVSSSELDNYSQSGAVKFRDGSLFRGTVSSLYGQSASAVFLVSDGKLRPIKSAEVYQSLFNDPNWSRVTWVPDDLLSKFEYSLGEIVEKTDIYPDGTLIKYSNFASIYLIENGKKRPIKSGQVFEELGFDRQNVVTVSDREIYPDGQIIE